MYLLAYPLLVAGLLLLVRQRNPKGDKAAVIDSLILTVGFALLSWVFLIAPIRAPLGLDWLAKGVSVAYPVDTSSCSLRRSASRSTPADVCLPFYLLVAEHRLSARHRLRLQLRAAQRHLQPSAGLRHRLDRLPRPLGGSRASPFDADARAAGRRGTRASHPHPSRAAGAFACLIAPSIRFWDRDSQPRRARHHQRLRRFSSCSSSRAWPVSVRKEEHRTVRRRRRCAAPAVRLSANDGDGVHDAVIAAVREVVSDQGARVRLLLRRSELSVVVASSEPMREPAPLDGDASGWVQATWIRTGLAERNGCARRGTGSPGARCRAASRFSHP